jgi:membrane fusion protein (multidrug efflux system)
MFARPRVVFSVREAAVVVPEEALVPVGRACHLQGRPGADGKPVSQRIEARIDCAAGKVEILSGCKAGTRW